MGIWCAHKKKDTPVSKSGCGVNRKYSTKHLLWSPVSPVGCRERDHDSKKWKRGNWDDRAMTFTVCSARWSLGESRCPGAKDLADGPSLGNATARVEWWVAVEDLAQRAQAGDADLLSHRLEEIARHFGILIH